MDERRAYALDWEDVVTGIRLVESVTNVFPGGGVLLAWEFSVTKK